MKKKKTGTDLAYIATVIPKREHGSARRYRQAGNFDHRVDDFLGDAVREIFLGRVCRHDKEGQNRKRRVCRFHLCRRRLLVDVARRPKDNANRNRSGPNNDVTQFSPGLGGDGLAAIDIFLSSRT